MSELETLVLGLVRLPNDLALRAALADYALERPAAVVELVALLAEVLPQWQHQMDERFAQAMLQYHIPPGGSVRRLVGALPGEVTAYYFAAYGPLSVRLNRDEPAAEVCRLVDYDKPAMWSAGMPVADQLFADRWVRQVYFRNETEGTVTIEHSISKRQQSERGEW